MTGSVDSRPAAEVAVRSLTPSDVDRLVELNDAAYPAVPFTTAPEMSTLLSLAELALGLERGRDAGATLVGFVIAMPSGAAYDSENFRYFEQRGVDHLYVDRIVIAESERGKGLGPVLYDRVFTAARERGRAEVTCEVNLDPPNPGSLAFHSRRGFAQVGTQVTKGGTVTVALLASSVR